MNSFERYELRMKENSFLLTREIYFPLSRSTPSLFEHTWSVNRYKNSLRLVTGLCRGLDTLITKPSYTINNTQ